VQQRDYSSFTAAAKSAFRKLAAELGYEQRSGVLYAKRMDGWYQVLGLQAAGYGNDFFYVLYGVAVPGLAPVGEAKPLADCGLIISERLRDVDETGAFGRASKRDIAASADRILIQYRKYALPWFEEHNSWNAIAAEYFRREPIEEAKLGSHSILSGADYRSAQYGWLLLKCNRTADAVRWLNEAERLLSLPVYLTRDGGIRHEPEKGARLQKPGNHHLETLAKVRETLRIIESMPN
jgi:hypothetical protein